MDPVIADYSGTPTLICPCGSTLIKIVVSLDPDTYEIADYTLTGYCYLCESRLTILCPADKVDDGGMVTV